VSRLFLTFACTSLVALGQQPAVRALANPRPTVIQQQMGTDAQIRHYESKLAASPGDFAAQIALVSAYLQKLRESADAAYLTRASQLVDAMLEHDSGNLAAMRFQNEIDLQRHDFQTVASRAEGMAKYAPSDPGIRGNLGDALMELGEYNKAGEAYGKMFTLRPNLASYNRLAYYRFVTGHAPEAIQLMQMAVEAGEAQPENAAWCRAELGDMFFKTGKLDEAEHAYRSALSLFPTLHRASAGLGKVAVARRQLALAIEDFKRAESIVPMVEYAGALEDLYAATGLPAKARQEKELVGMIARLGAANREKTNRNLALVLADHDRDLNLALELMQAEVPVRGDVYTWDAFSWILFKNGRLDQAKAASDKAVRLETPEPLFYYHAYKIALAGGEEDKAKQYAGRLKALNARFDLTKALEN
jgi:tetratricopeptide (TPR) repeat protein